MRVKVNLDTMTSIQKFVDVVSNVDADVMLKDNAGHCVNGKSIIANIYTMEWVEVYCECDRDISGLILPWII